MIFAKDAWVLWVVLPAQDGPRQMCFQLMQWDLRVETNLFVGITDFTADGWKLIDNNALE